MKKKILILSASYGGGHDAAARALAKTAKSKYDCDVTILDFVLFMKKKGSWSKKIYEYIAERFPWLFSFVFHTTDHIFFRYVRFSFFRSSSDSLDHLSPDGVLVTYPLWLPLLQKSFSGGEKKKPVLGVVVTDAMKIHHSWHAYSYFVDWYFVIDEQTKTIFRKKFHHHRQNIIVSFFPIEEQYFFDKSVIKNHRILLLLSSLRWSLVKSLCQELLAKGKKVMVLQGRNKSVYQRTQQFFQNKSGISFAEYLPIREELKNIDCVIGKSGGAITCECIATDTPLFVPFSLPGQEEGNIQLLETHGLGLFESDPHRLVEAIDAIDSHRTLPYFHRLKKKNSCDFILDILLQPSATFI